MSIKCNKCGNKIFDSNAYLKISKVEKQQQDKVDKLIKDLELSKEEFGKNHHKLWRFKEFYM